MARKAVGRLVKLRMGKSYERKAIGEIDWRYRRRIVRAMRTIRISGEAIRLFAIRRGLTLQTDLVANGMSKPETLKRQGLGDWLSDLTRWDRLRRIGQSRFVRNSYYWIVLVPVVVKLLEKTEETMPIRVLGVTWNLTMSLPFSWELFFFSAVCFAIGRFIFAMHCPKLIADYASYSEFVADGESCHLLKLALLWAILCKDEETKKALIGVFVATTCDDRPDWRDADYVTVEHQFILACNIVRKSDAFHFVGNLAAQEKFTYRVLAGFFFMLGIVLMGWVFIDTILFVVRYVISH